MDFLLDHEATLREWAFFGALVVMLGWESFAPRRTQGRHSVAARWLGNGALLVLDSIILRWCFPVLAMGVAFLAEQRGWGLFNQLAFPGFVAVAASVLLLDLLSYARHRLFHAIPWCWRFHRVHHSDQDVDWSTGVRFHPFEAVVTASLRVLFVVILGAPAVAVLIFELLTAATAPFQHGNVVLPEAADRWLRRLLVTPDMHRVHHSVIRRETDSNFGVVFPWWDRLLGTYRKDPLLGDAHMQLGIGEFSHARYDRLHWLLAMPFMSSQPSAGAHTHRRRVDHPPLPEEKPPARRRSIGAAS